MKFKAFSSLMAASTIFVSVLPATAQFYPKSSIHRSSNSTAVYRSGSGSSRTTSTSKSTSSNVKISLPGITNINRQGDRALLAALRDRNYSISVTPRENRRQSRTGFPQLRVWER